MSYHYGVTVEDVWNEYGKNFISEQFLKQPREEVHTSFWKE